MDEDIPDHVGYCLDPCLTISTSENPIHILIAHPFPVWVYAHRTLFGDGNIPMPKGIFQSRDIQHV